MMKHLMKMQYKTSKAITTENGEREQMTRALWVVALWTSQCHSHHSDDKMDKKMTMVRKTMYDQCGYRRYCNQVQSHL